MRKIKAFTLTEVMVATAIFSFALLGMVSMGTLMHRLSVENVAAGISLHIADGMMEQIRSMPYNEVLARAAADSSGSTSIPFIRYRPLDKDGTPGAQVEHLIPVNAAGFTRLEGVNLATHLTPDFKVMSNAPMEMDVRLVMLPVSDANFANGVTVELFYRYRPHPSSTYKQRAFRSFIPRFFQ